MAGNIAPHSDIKEFTDFSSDISLLTNGDGRDFAEGARNIFIVDDGNSGDGGAIAVKTSTGETRVLTAVKSGQYVDPSPVWVTKILAVGTDVDKVIVGW